VTDSEPTPNPYAPSAIVDDAAADERWDRVAAANDHDSDAETPRLTLTRTALRWLFVCAVSAVPSFVYGYLVTNGRIGGMVSGILIFAAGYTLLDYRTASHPWRQMREVRRTLRIAYGTRIAVSIIFPIGGFLDLVCGFVTISMMSPLVGGGYEDDFGFFASLITTLVQGCVLNLVLGSFALLVHLIQIAILAIRRRRLPPGEVALGDGFGPNQ
jgi:hypothetical protein